LQRFGHNTAADHLDAGTVAEIEALALDEIDLAHAASPQFAQHPVTANTIRRAGIAGVRSQFCGTASAQRIIVA